jgi:hypothetical protein
MGVEPTTSRVRFQIKGRQQIFANKTLQAFQYIRPTMFGFVRHTSALVLGQKADSAGVNIAPAKSALLRSAPLRLASVRSALVRIEKRRSEPPKSTPEAFTPRSDAPCRFIPLRSALPRFAPVKSGLQKRVIGRPPLVPGNHTIFQFVDVVRISHQE